MAKLRSAPLGQWLNGTGKLPVPPQPSRLSASLAFLPAKLYQEKCV